MNKRKKKPIQSVGSHIIIRIDNAIEVKRPTNNVL